MEEAMGNEDKQYLTFNLGDEVFSLDIDKVFSDEALNTLSTGQGSEQGLAGQG